MQFTEFPTKAFPDLDDKPKIGTGHLYISCEKRWFPGFFIFFPFFSFIHKARKAAPSCTQLHPVVRFPDVSCQLSGVVKATGSILPASVRIFTAMLHIAMTGNRGSTAGESLVDHGRSSFFTLMFFQWHDHFSPLFFSDKKRPSIGDSTQF